MQLLSSTTVIYLGTETVEYALTVSPRAKRVSIIVRHDGSLKVTTPRHVPHAIIEDFMISKSRWILEKINFYKNNQDISLCKDKKVTYETHKEQAKVLAIKKVEDLNKIYNLTWNTISIRNQKTRWGSCSRKGNLNFNYKIALLPEHLADYIIIHELCHLKEFNHGKNFWNLVAKTLPNHKELRKELQKYSLRF